MKVLVTGGSGFIGGYACRELDERGHQPVVLDRHPRALTYETVLGDVRDPNGITDAVSHVDGVIHLAGVLGTAECVQNPGPAAEINVMGGLNVLQACAQYDVPLVDISVGNWFENNTYSITKHMIERMVLMNARHRGLPQAAVRAFHAYGPGQGVSAPYGSSKVRKIVPSFAARALHGDVIEIYGDGQQSADLIWAGDIATVLVRALEWLANGGDAAEGIVFEAGTGKPVTVLDVARLIQAEAASYGKQCEIRHLPMRAGETPGTQMRADPATLVPLGIDPGDFMPLDDGISRTMAWYHREFTGVEL